MEIMVDVFLFVTSFMDFLASFFLDPTRVVPTAAATWHTAVQWMAVTSHAVLPATETTKEVLTETINTHADGELDK